MKKYFFIQNLMTFEFYSQNSKGSDWTKDPFKARIFDTEKDAENYLLKNLSEYGFYTILPNYQ